MDSNQFHINIKNNDEVIANKKQFVTTKQIYNNIYINQFLELFKLITAFLIARLLMILIEIGLLNYYINNTIVN